MTAKEYLKKAKDIAGKEFLTITDLAKEIGISWHTFNKIDLTSHTCSMRTVRKIKKFVEDWNMKNPTIDDRE